MKPLVIIWIGLTPPIFVKIPVISLIAKYEKLPDFKSANDERIEK